MARWASRIIVSASLAVLPLVAFTLTGCSTTEGFGAKAARSARGFQDELAIMPGQIDKVMGDLNTLTAGTTTDRKAALNTYDKDLAKLTEHAKTVAHHRDKAEKNTQKYFREWLQQSRKFQDPAKREAALQSLEAGRSRTDLARGYLNQGANDFRSLIDQLNGIKSTLTKDLSPASVQKVGSNLGPVLDQANNVKDYIARLNEQIDTALAAR